MPTYNYLCKKCKKKFQYFQRITAEPITECPTCKGPVERLISGGVGLIFKGSGFYATDYRKKGSAAKSEKTPVCPKAKKDDKGCVGCPGSGSSG